MKQALQLLMFQISLLAISPALAEDHVATKSNDQYTANQNGLYQDFTQINGEVIKTFSVSNGATISLSGPSGQPLKLNGLTGTVDGYPLDVNASNVTINSDLQYTYGSNKNGSGYNVYSGIRVINGGQVVLNGNLTATSTDSGYKSPKSAVYVEGVNNSGSRAELNGNVKLTIAGGKGLLASNGGVIDMTSDNGTPYLLTVTNQSNQRSVEAGGGSTVRLDLVDMNGTSYNNGVGLYASNESSITFMGGKFNQGSNSYGANALFALNNSSVIALGYNGGHLLIKTGGNNEIGAWATGNSKVVINKGRYMAFNTVIETTGPGQSHGLAAGSLGGGSAAMPIDSNHNGSQYGNSEVTVYGKIDITTRGVSSAGLRVMGDGAKITFVPLDESARNTITSMASAIRYSFANGYSLDSSNGRIEGGQIITLSNTDMAHLAGGSSTAGLIEVGGLAGSTTDGQNGSIMNVPDAVKGAILDLSNSSATARDGRSLLNVNASRSSGADFFASSFTLNAKDSELVGRAVTSSAVATDGVSQAVLNLDASRWFLLDNNSSNAGHYAQSNLTELNLNGQSQIFLNSREAWQAGFSASQPNHYASLQLGSLSGAGMFHFYTDIVNQNTDIVNQSTDKLLITEVDGSKGNHSVLVANDASQSTLGNEHIEIIDTAGGSGQFALYQNALVELGDNTYALRKNEDDNWELYGYTAPPIDPWVPTEPTEPTEPTGPTQPQPQPGTSTSRAFHAQVHTHYLMSYLDMQTLLQRMGELRHAERDTDGNVWLRADGGRLHAFSGSNFDGYRLNYQSLQAGVDRRVPTNSGDLFVGALIGYTQADQRFNEGSGDADNTHLGVYATWLHENGLYIDAMLKGAAMKSRFSVTDTQGNWVKESGRSTGYSASVEAGKRFSLQRGEDSEWFVEPQAQLVYTKQGGFSSRSSNGMRIKYEGYDSLLARVGGIVGYTLNSGRDKAEVYLKGGYVRELMADDIGYRVNDTPRQSSDYSGGWREVAIGVSLRRRGGHSLFMEVGYHNGDNFNQSRANIGYRYEY